METRRRPSLLVRASRKLSYELDLRLARGALPAILVLAIVAVGVVLGTAILLVLTGVTGELSDGQVGESVWLAITRALDPGTMADDVGWPFRLISLAATVGGVLVISALIGLITSGIDRRLEDFREGATRVVEHGHIVILGWSSKVPNIIQEQFNAEEHDRRPTRIAVLGLEGKLLMERETLHSVRLPRSGRVVFRRGNPATVSDLELLNIAEARRIILVSPEGEAAPDSQVVRTLFAVNRLADSRTPVVAEFLGSPEADAAIDSVDTNAISVVSNEVIAKVAAQVIRFPGLSRGYEELLDFAGDEFYVVPAGSLAGQTYGTAVFSFEKCSVVGLYEPGKGAVLSPSADTVVTPSARLIGIAQTAQAMQPDRSAQESQAGPSELADRHQTSTRTLIIGWSRVAPLLLAALDSYAREGSEADVAIIPSLVDAAQISMLDGLRNIQAKVHELDETDYGEVGRMLSLRRYERIVVLAYRDGLNQAQSDARSILTLVHLRRFLQQQDAPATPILVELLNDSDRHLIAPRSSEEIIVSDRLAGQMISQLSVSPALDEVFGELFEARGADIVMRPLSDLGIPEGRSSWAALVDAALAAGETAIGLLPQSTGEVEINLPKSEMIHHRENDLILTIAPRLSSSH